jgi:hypothetical protein
VVPHEALFFPSTLFDRTPWLGETAAEALATCNRDDGSRHVRRNVILSRMTSWRLGSIISGSGVICNLIVFLSRQERGSPQDWQPNSLGKPSRTRPSIMSTMRRSVMAPAAIVISM